MMTCEALRKVLPCAADFINMSCNSPRCSTIWAPTGEDVGRDLRLPVAGHLLVARPPGCLSLPAFWGKGPSPLPHSDPSTSGLTHHTVRSPHHINRPRLWDQAACIFNFSCYKYTPWWIHLLPLFQTPVLACLNQPSALTQCALRRLLWDNQVSNVNLEGPGEGRPGIKPKRRHWLCKHFSFQRKD